MAAATHPNDGLPDPAGRIVFGRLTRVDDIRDQLVSLYAIDPDGSDLVPLLDCEVGRPRFSPDGSRLAFGIALDDGTMQIATMAADGSDLTVLTSTDGYADTPDWSPDGSWLVYSHSPDPCLGPSWEPCVIGEGMHQSLWRMDADGSDQRLIGDPDAYDWEPRVSPDGREVVFTRIVPPGSTDTNWFTPMIRDLETGAERVVTVNEREPEHPEWSRDGTSIIYNTLHDADDHSIGMERIERVPANDATAEPVLLYAPPGGGLGAAKPTHSPDGSRIAFGCSMAMCVMDADGSNVTELLRVPSAELNHFAWGRAR
jgi:Tol biopolymer transport system component